MLKDGDFTLARRVEAVRQVAPEDVIVANGDDANVALLRAWQEENSQ